MSHIKGYAQFIYEQRGGRHDPSLNRDEQIANLRTWIQSIKPENASKQLQAMMSDQLDKLLLQQKRAANKSSSSSSSANATTARPHDGAKPTTTSNTTTAARPHDGAKPTTTSNKTTADAKPATITNANTVKKPVAGAAKKQEPFQMSSGRGNEALRARNIAKAKARKQNPTVNTKPTLNKAGTDSGSGVDALKQRMIKRSEERGK